MASEFSIIKSFKWCVELPSEECPRESPVFTVEGNECSFQFVLEQSLFGSAIWYYYLHLELKRRLSEFKTFTGELHVGFKKDNIFFDKRKTIRINKPDKILIWHIPEHDLKIKLPTDYAEGNWIQFLFFFEDVVECHLSTSKKKDDKSVQTPSYIDTNILLEGVSKDFSTLLEEGPGHDVEFMCGGEAIQAHMNILSCRSNVFSSMLRTDMVERKTGQVIIQDMEAAHFKLFLRYTYTGVLPEMTVEVALSFYEASDKYAVDALKQQCTSFLLENLSPENACKVLIVADRHGDSYFKSNVMEYMMKVKIPRIGEKWTEFCQEYPSLANEVLNLLFQRFFFGVKCF